MDIEKIYNEYFKIVYRYVLSLSRDPGLSEDIAQETFLKAYTHITQFKNISSFKTWLFRIAYNVHYDYRRKQSAESATAIDGEHAGRALANSQSYTLNSTLKMDLYKALSLLKDEERTCITLQLIDGQPIDKISDITGMPQNTVKSHLKRGKDKLTDYLKNNGYDR